MDCDNAVKLDSTNMTKFAIMNTGNRSNSVFMRQYRNGRRSNLPFQIALYINLWVFPVWLLIVVINMYGKYHSLTNVYKLVTVATVLILSISESFKLYLGYLGNLVGKIPELACCWLILIFIELPLEMFVLFDREILSHYSETFINTLMVCLLFIEVVTCMIALLNLADHRAKIFYLMHLYET